MRALPSRATVVLTALLVALPVLQHSDAAPRKRITNSFDARTPAQTPGLPDLDRLDPVKYKYKDAIVEHVLVPSRDGINEIWVDLIRPKTPKGVKVPTIMMASPYFNTLGRGYKGECKTPHQSPPGGLPGSPGAPGLSSCAKSQTGFPEWYDEYFVPRGYAFAAMDLRGTRNTSGCQTYGDRDEVYDAVDVVDWLATRSWSNGRVGMTGGSYDGTIAIGAAAEQPISGKKKDALAAVIPIRAIDAWYDYHFMNGVQSDGHRATPALFTAALAGTDLQNSGTADRLYAARVAERKACIATFGALTDAGYASPYQNATDPFWAERDFRKDAKGIRAATFWIHGLFDFNVKTNNAGNMWLSLPKKLPKKLWLLNGDHFDPRCPSDETCSTGGHVVPFPLADKFVEANHRWWLQFLKKVPAGALSPQVEVQGPDGKFAASKTWPVSKRDLVVYPTTTGKAAPRPVGEPAEVKWADNPGNVGAPAVQRFVTAPFTKRTRISGQFQFDLKYAAAGPDTAIAVQVDMLAPGVPDNATVDDKMYDDENSGVMPVTYGWLHALVRKSIKPRGPSTPVLGTPLTPGTPVVSKFPSLYTDILVEKGQRLRFTFSKAAGGGAALYTGGIVTMHVGPKTSSIRIPVVR